jgi:hypothetical protein
VPDEFARDMRDRFALPRSYFQPAVFEPTFTAPLMEHLGSFPIRAVALSILPDTARLMYQHHRTGYLVDPGSAWLNRSMEENLANLDATVRFREEFRALGRISVEDMSANYRRLIPLIREANGAEVLVFNTLDFEPGDETALFRGTNLDIRGRRRRINLALMELADELGFHVVDVDRLLKLHGVQGQVDFSHFPVEMMRVVGAEVHRILRDLDIL